MDSAALDRINSFHIRIGDRANAALCVLTTLVLIVYSAVGIVMFLGPATHPIPFLVSYSLWVVIGLVILVRYRDNPSLIIGLYMLIMSVDRLNSLLVLHDEYTTLSLILEAAISLFMLVSGIRWLLGNASSRIPAILSSSLFIILSLGGLVQIITSAGDFTGNIQVMLSAVSFLLCIAIYALIIVLMLCNNINKTRYFFKKKDPE